MRFFAVAPVHPARRAQTVWMRAGLLAHGLAVRTARPARLLMPPLQHTDWHNGDWARLAAYSCGGSTGLAANGIPVSRFSPCGPPASGPTLPHVHRTNNEETESSGMIPRINFEPDAKAPLDGIKVVDLSRLVAGNMVSLQLADQGAEVSSWRTRTKATRCAPGGSKAIPCTGRSMPATKNPWR